ncbi:DUF6919 domain-containing protein [Streptomyces sp. NPDC001450]
MPLPWMSRQDRNRWKAAQNVGQLGGLMALWLEGIIESRPGYQPRFGPDEETAHLVPSLAALCRAGFVTTGSQPGFAGTGADGLWWEQRAAVEGLVADPELLRRLDDAATNAGMLVRVSNHWRGEDREPITVTTRDGEPVTSFGGRVSRADLAAMWRGLNHQLYREVATGTYLTIVAPEYGLDSERLWAVLDFISGRRRVDRNSPWATRTRPIGEARD